jgi:hypothetical protein
MVSTGATLLFLHLIQKRAFGNTVTKLRVTQKTVSLPAEHQLLKKMVPVISIPSIYIS